VENYSEERYFIGSHMKNLAMPAENLYKLIRPQLNMMSMLVFAAGVLITIASANAMNIWVDISFKGFKLTAIRSNDKTASELQEDNQKLQNNANQEKPYKIKKGDVRFSGYTAYTNFDKAGLKNVAVGLRLSDEAIALMKSDKAPNYISFMVESRSNKLPFYVTFVDEEGKTPDNPIKKSQTSSTTNREQCVSVPLGDRDDFEAAKLQDIRIEQKGIKVGETEFEIKAVNFGKTCI
jgi:hypothetical protein